MQPQGTTPADSPAPVWIGIDVAKATVDAALHGAQPIGSPRSFPRTRDGMRALAEWARGQVPADAAFRAILEATGRYSLEAIGWLLEIDPAIAPACVNPLHAKRFAQSLGLRNKTDRDDARMLARMGAERRPAPFAPPTAAMAELRSLVRERRELVEEKTRLANRASEGAASAFVARERQRLAKSLERLLARLEAEIRRVARRDEALWADIGRVATIPGVGFVTAVTVLAELGDLRRFATGRQLAAFAGLSPRRFESGTSVSGRTSLCKQGNPAVRAVLYMSAVTTARMADGMKGVYERLVANGKHAKSALGALMRRQLLLMRTLLVKGENYGEHAEDSADEEAKSLA